MGQTSAQGEKAQYSPFVSGEFFMHLTFAQVVHILPFAQACGSFIISVMARQEKLFKQIPKYWKPEFIPYYPEVKEKYGLNDKETLIYGFIRFFLKSCTGQFYFSNDQIRAIFGDKRKETIAENLAALASKCPEIELEYSEEMGNMRYVRFKGFVNPLTEKRKTSYGKPQAIENNKENTLNYIYTLKELFDKNIEIPTNQFTTLLEQEKEKFLGYWCEKNYNGKKERWQMEKVFDVKRRWRRWLSNVEKRMKPQEFIPKKEIRKESEPTTQLGGFQKIGK